MNKITDMSWLDLKLDQTVSKEDVERQTITVKAVIDRLYGNNQVPGVILADEVGMGKTFVSLAVAAALFRASDNQCKVLILATSRSMKQTWSNRWNRFKKAHKQIVLPSGLDIARLEDVEEGICFASLEELKHTTGAEVLTAFELAMRRRNSPKGRTRKLLRRELFLSRNVAIPKKMLVEEILAAGDIEISDEKLESFLKENYDTTKRNWVSAWAAYEDLRKLIFRSRRPSRFRLDLLILDEAHRLVAEQRQAFLHETIDARTTKTLFVTATPFSLRVSELYDRIANLFQAAGIDEETRNKQLKGLKDLLEQFRTIVRSRDDPPSDLKNRIEKELGRFLVRNTWPDVWLNGNQRRITHELKVPLELFNEGHQAYAMFSLEREFVRKRSEGRRSYITSNRETLCSSYAAVMDSNKDDPNLFYEVIPFLPKDKECPKLEFAVNQIFSIVKSGEIGPNKIVVFCARNPTIRKLRAKLEDMFTEDEKIARDRWNTIRNALSRNDWKGNWAKARLATYVYPKRRAAEVKTSIRELEKLIGQAGTEDDSWEQMWRLGRKIDWVMTITGEEEDGRTIDEVQAAFNVPGPPYVVICSKRAGESIDLHRWCRRIMHFDLHWSPATMEQRVGRVDRINSLGFREQKPIEISYFRILGTYEERILSVVRERMEMTRVLLGAGEWLSEHDDVTKFGNELNKYKLNFAPSDETKQRIVSNLPSSIEKQLRSFGGVIEDALGHLGNAESSTKMNNWLW